jgi:serine/threonine protein kinase/tetratricopeptide (TPR) repeat protein
MINRRFKILTELGEGGTGKVFRVEDTLTGQHVALKAFSPSTAKAMDVEEVRNEFSILVNLSHPNLVRVYDFGTILQSDDRELVGRPFYTMEYVEGRDSLAFFKDKPLNLEKIELLEKVLLKTLGVLEYIHREGIIHFDIKPQNLIITQLGEDNEISVKLTDFGFSAAKSEAVDFPVRGTLEYAAPETLRGLPLDSRLDLYSLGSTMYHLSHGNCPFEARNPTELVKKVLTEELPQIGGQPREFSLLSRIIGTLCQKDPDRRYASAFDALLEFHARKYASLIKGSQMYIHKPRFAGRKKEKEFIGKALETLAHEGANRKVIAILGGEGMGKSELLKEAIGAARSRGMIVLEIRNSASQDSFGSIALSLQHLELELQSRGSAEELPEKKHLSRGLDGKKTVASRKSLQSSDWNAELDRVAHSYARFIFRASKVVPFVLLVDDFDKIDPFSQATIAYVSKNLAEARLAVVVSVTGDLSTELPFSEEISHRILLDELSRQDVAELIRKSLGDQFAATKIPEKLYELYGGIPPLIEQAVHVIVDTLPLSAFSDPKELGEFADALERFLPARLEEFFARRFSRLTKEELLLLQVLSCFEHPPLIALLKKLVPMQAQRLEDYLDLLQREGHTFFLEDRSRCNIRHSKLKQYLYTSIGEAQSKLHLFIASNMKDMLNDGAWSDLEELARQYSLGEDAGSASLHYEVAGEQAAQHQVLSHAINDLEKAVELGKERTDGDSYAALQEKLARVYFASGAHLKSAHMYQGLLEQLPERDERRVPVHLGIGRALSRLGDHSQALSHLEKALGVGLAPSTRFEILQEIISLKIAGGYYDEAVELCQNQKVFASEQPDKGLLASVETNLGRAEFHRGKFEEARTSFLSALEINRKLEDRQKIVDSLINLGNISSVTGEYRSALEQWGQALKLARELGTLHHEGQIQNNMGIAHYKLREYQEARSCYEKAREVFEELGSKNGLALTHANLGEVAFAEGEYEQALEWWTMSLDLNDAMKDSGGVVEALLQLALARWVFGDVEQLQHVLRRAESLIREYNLSTFRGHLSYLKGLLSSTLQKYQEARTLFLIARDAFQQDGDHEKQYQALLRTAEVLIALGQHQEAGNLLKSMWDDRRLKAFPLIKAEFCYLAGCVARICPNEAFEKPVVYFKEGLETIENEALGEVSWKLSYAIAQEYARRGQREKAERNYVNTRVIIEHFTSRIKSARLREQYLSVDEKGKILSEISSYLGQEKGGQRVQVER